MSITGHGLNETGHLSFLYRRLMTSAIVRQKEHSDFMVQGVGTVCDGRPLLDGSMCSPYNHPAPRDNWTMRLVLTRLTFFDSTVLKASH